MLQHVFHALHEHGIRLEAMLLKPNMVLAGTAFTKPADTEAVAAATLTCIKRGVPPAMPGIVFLSGGQSDEQATANLNALNRLGGAPWELSFFVWPGLAGACVKNLGRPIAKRRRRTAGAPPSREM